MNITDCYDLPSLIREMEAALQIEDADFEEQDMDIIISNVKKRISRQYQINLSDYKINADELAFSDFRKSLSLFVDNIARIHAKFAGYAQIERYHTKYQTDLNKINYLGFDEKSLRTALLAIHTKIMQPRVTDVIKAIKGKLGTINTCIEKRLFMLIVITHELGFNEVAACISEIFVQGTIK